MPLLLARRVVARASAYRARVGCEPLAAGYSFSRSAPRGMHVASAWRAGEQSTPVAEGALPVVPPVLQAATSASNVGKPYPLSGGKHAAAAGDANPLSGANPAADGVNVSAAAAAATAPPGDSVYEESIESPPPVAAAAASVADLAKDSLCPRVGEFESSLCEFQENFDRLQRGAQFTKVLRQRAVGQREVFANADLPLSRIEAWGFDYDYTLAGYNDNVLEAIYSLAKAYLLERMGYPPELGRTEFERGFAIRGLHFDTCSGYLLKLDQFNKVQTSCCFLGRQRVPVADIVRTYGGVSIATDYASKHLRSLVDLFAVAEATLLADCIEVFRSKGLEIEADYLYRDVRAAVEHVHVSGQLHSRIMAQPENYLDKAPQLADFLLGLRESNKFVFLLTNSPFAFVDAGMRYMLAGLEDHALGKQLGVRSAADWTHLFDVVITSARKPGFFTRQGQFRRVDVENGRPSWRPVHRFERGAVYTEGSLTEFMRLASLSRAEAAAAKASPTGSAASACSIPLAEVPLLRGHQVLYHGDHVGADLTAPWQQQRWRTAAVVPEIGRETSVQASPAFKAALRRLLHVEALITYGQRLTGDAETEQRMVELKRQRQAIKHDLLCMFNPRWGSCFRTSTHRTSFFDDVGRFADVYTANVVNFLNYDRNYTFYAQRLFFPHENAVTLDDSDVL